MPLAGSLAEARTQVEQLVERTGGKRGTSEVDAEFLKEIEGWREALARNLALRNPGLSEHELNFAVQRTIDRIIFLRMVALVERMLDLHKRLAAAAIPAGKRLYQRQIEATVYELYGLTEEEIAIVEGAGS